MQERLRAFGAEPEPGVEAPPPRPSAIADKVLLAGCVIGVIAVGVFAILGVAATFGWL